MFIVAAIAAILLLFSQSDDKKPPANPNNRKDNNRQAKPQPPTDVSDRGEQFNRRVSNIVYTKHARCRMRCRHIDDSEVKEILEKGRINYDKSDPAGRPDPKFALEGRTHDDQYVRIIFAPAEHEVVVITVIDLEKEWSCNCK